MSYLLFFIIIIMFFMSKNILTTIIVFLSLMYFIEVVFVQIFFFQDFSNKVHLFDSLDTVSYNIFIFTFVFFIFNYRIIDNIKFKTCFSCFKLRDMNTFFLLAFIFLYSFYYDRIVYHGDYHTIMEHKSPLVEYMTPLLTVLLIFSKGRFLIVIPFLSIALLYGVNGERLRMFIYIFIIFIIFKDNFKFINFKISLIFALLLSIFISFVRGETYIQTNPAAKEIHMSHFGELTISSMYLIEFSKNISDSEKLEYMVGIFSGNFIPSSILPMSMDIKRSLREFANVPGGGWLPIWFYSIGGYWLSIFMSFLFAISFAYLNRKLNRTNKQNSLYIYLSTVYILILATSNNWLMYSPYQLIKFPLYAIILLFLFNMLKSIKKST